METENTTTENNDVETPPNNAAETKPETDTTETKTEDTPDTKGNREAAKYRRQLREAEAELTAAREQLESYKTKEAEAQRKVWRNQSATEHNLPGLADYITGDTEEEIRVNALHLAEAAEVATQQLLNPDSEIIQTIANMPGFTEAPRYAAMLANIHAIINSDDPEETIRDLSGQIDRHYRNQPHRITYRSIREMSPGEPTTNDGFMRQLFDRY